LSSAGTIADESGEISDDTGRIARAPAFGHCPGFNGTEYIIIPGRPAGPNPEAMNPVFFEAVAARVAGFGFAGGVRALEQPCYTQTKALPLTGRMTVSGLV
jgi:hypothetical protein